MAWSYTIFKYVWLDTRWLGHGNSANKAQLIILKDKNNKFVDKKINMALKYIPT